MTLRPRRIALVGFMGSGKTTVGRILAARLGYAFVDTDEEVEAATMMDVARLFAAKGEAFFRQQEREAILRVIRRDACVIATGGGAFIQAACAEVLLATSFTVFLECDFDEAFRRAQAARVRPLLETGRNAAAALYTDRKDKYARAHAVVDTTRSSPEEVASTVMATFV